MKKILFVCFACTFLLSGCIRPYQPDVQQGNIINNSDLSEIRLGMSKQEVLYILGTPLVIDPFNESRWEYYYSKLNKRNKQTDTRVISVVFEGDNLSNIMGDVDITNIEKLEPSTEDKQHGGTIITKPTQKEKGLFNRIFK